MWKLIFILFLFPYIIISAQVDSFRIVFQHDFESNSVGAYDTDDGDWDTDWTPHSNDEVQQSFIEQCADADNSTKVMRWDYDSLDWGMGMGSGINWWTYLEGNYDEMYLSYRLRLKEGFDPVLSGKFPGLYAFPDFDFAPIDSDEGFSCKFSWTYNCNGDSQIYIYYYDHNTTGPFGEAECFTYVLDSFKTQWKTVTLRMVMNTFTGGSANSDGIAEVFMDSVCVFTDNNFKWVEDEDLGVNRIHMEFFFGGGDASFAANRDEWIKIDDVICWYYGTDVTGLPKGNNTNSVGDTIIIPPADYSGSDPMRYEFNDDTPNYTDDVIDDTYGTGQIIRVGAAGRNVNHKVDSIHAILHTDGDAGTLYFYIDSVSASDSLPRGTGHICSGTIDNIDITEDSGGDDYYITMTCVDSLYADSLYAVIAVGDNAQNSYWHSSSADGYSGGEQLMKDPNWRTATGDVWDIVFEIYATEAEDEEEEVIDSDTVVCYAEPDTMISHVGATDDYWTVVGDKWEAQVFVPTSDFDLSCIQFKIRRDETGDTIEVLLFAIEDSIPTGDSLSWGSRDISWVSTTEYDTINVEISPYMCAAADTFCIIWKVRNGDLSEWKTWARVSSMTSGGYSGGYRLNTMDGGSTWTKDTGTDFWFVIYGELALQNTISFKKNASAVQFKKNASNVNFLK